MKTLRILTASALVLSLAINPALAGSVAGTGGATEITQLANNVELVAIAEQTAQQVEDLLQQIQILQQQLQYAAQNMIAAPQQIWGQAQADLLFLTNLVNQANTVTYAGGAIAQRFQQLYPGYQGAPSDTQYAGLITSSQSAQQSALQSAGLNVSQMTSERAVVQSIQSMSAGSPGALQAVQAGNMLTSQVIDQLQKTRMLLADQTSAQANAAATQNQSEANSMTALKAFAAPYVKSTIQNQSDTGGLTSQSQ